MTTKAQAKAAAAEPAADQTDFQPGVLYDVQLTRAVEFPPGSGNYFRPGHKCTFAGEVAAQFRDAIGAAEPSET